MLSHVCLKTLGHAGEPSSCKASRRESDRSRDPMMNERGLTSKGAEDCTLQCSDPSPILSLAHSHCSLHPSTSHLLPCQHWHLPGSCSQKNHSTPTLQVQQMIFARFSGVFSCHRASFRRKCSRRKSSSKSNIAANKEIQQILRNAKQNW